MFGRWHFRRRRPPPRPLLNLGCGSRRHPDWTNVDLVPAAPDVIAADLRRPLPFPDRCFAAAYASHVLEHLPPAEAWALVLECRRVLEPGAPLRIVVPDLEGIARAYLASLERAVAETEPHAAARWEHRWMTVELLDQLVRDQGGGAMRRWWNCEPIPCRDLIERRLGTEAVTAIAAIASHRRRSGLPPQEPDAILFQPPASARSTARFHRRGERHRWMYDRVSLADLLTRAGFVNPRRVGPAESSIRGFATSGLDADPTGRPLKPDSLYMEASCP